MPCSDKHGTCPERGRRIPIRYDWPAQKYELDPEAESALNPRESAAKPGPNASVPSVSSVAKPGRGGPRPGSGPPKGNLNALKHGRFSTRHKQLLEALLVVPEAREALISIAKRNRQRVRKAELEAAYLLMRWLARDNPAALLPTPPPPAAEESPPSAGHTARPGAEGSGNQPLPSPAHGREAGHAARPGGEVNDQTKNDQLIRALANMQHALEKRILRKTTRQPTPKTPHQPNPPTSVIPTAAQRSGGTRR